MPYPYLGAFGIPVLGSMSALHRDVNIVEHHILYVPGMPSIGKEERMIKQRSMPLSGRRSRFSNVSTCCLSHSRMLPPWCAKFTSPRPITSTSIPCHSAFMPRGKVSVKDDKMPRWAEWKCISVVSGLLVAACNKEPSAACAEMAADKSRSMVNAQFIMHHVYWAFRHHLPNRLFEGREARQMRRLLGEAPCTVSPAVQGSEPKVGMVGARHPNSSSSPYHS